MLQEYADQGHWDVKVSPEKPKSKPNEKVKPKGQHNSKGLKTNRNKSRKGRGGFLRRGGRGQRTRGRRGTFPRRGGRGQSTRGRRTFQRRGGQGFRGRGRGCGKILF